MIGAYTILKEQTKAEKAKDYQNFIPLFILFAGICAYAIIEVQPRYAYLLQVTIYILAAGGVQYLMPKLKKYVRQVLNRVQIRRILL